VKVVRIKNKVLPFGAGRFQPFPSALLCCCVRDSICIKLSGWKQTINSVTVDIPDTFLIATKNNGVNNFCHFIYVTDCTPIFQAKVYRAGGTFANPIILELDADQILTLGVVQVGPICGGTIAEVPPDQCVYKLTFAIHNIERGKCGPNLYPSIGGGFLRLDGVILGQNRLYKCYVEQSLINAGCANKKFTFTKDNVCGQGFSSSTTITPGSVEISWGSQATCSGYGSDTTPRDVSVMRMALPIEAVEEFSEPVSSHAVVTLAVGRRGREMLAVTRPAMEAAAGRWGADFHVIGGDETAFNIGEKLRLRPYVEQYERVLYLDADVIVRPDSPNPFELLPPGVAYMHDDLPHLTEQGKPTEWIDTETQAVVESQGEVHGGPFSQYWNTGIMLVDRAHAAAFEPPKHEYPVYHCSEQHWLNHQFRKLGVSVAELGRRWSWQHWIDPTMQQTEGAHLLHFSGMASLGTGEEKHRARLSLMARVAGVQLPTFARVPLPLCSSLAEVVEQAAGCNAGPRCTWRCVALDPAVRTHQEAADGEPLHVVPVRDCDAECPGFAPT
jgi:hypothetical protein